MRKLVGAVGNYVEGERFWGRKKELVRLQELISEGAHVSIMAPRRTGKTSLMHQAGNRLQPEFIPLYIDMQAAESAADLVANLTASTRLHDTLWEKAESIFSNIFKLIGEKVETISISELKIQIRSGLAGGGWQEKGSQILDTLAAHEKRVVLFIDELPILVARLLEPATPAGKAAALSLLTWLREQGQKHQGRMSMVFAGSIGLEPLLNRAGLSANINHLTPFTLNPWTDNVALGCLKALAANYEIALPEPTALNMLNLLGCNIPYHVQLFFFQVREYCQDTEQTSCPPEAIDEIFESRMLRVQGQAGLDHMEERLRNIMNVEENRLAKDLLTHTAITGSIDLPHMHSWCDRYSVAPEERSRCLSDLFRILEHDGYLQKNTDGQYIFVSNLLRQWWRARFEAFFKAV